MKKEKNVFHINTKIMILIAMIMIIFGGTIFALMYRAYINHEVAMMAESLSKSAVAISNEMNGDQIEVYAKTLEEDSQYETLFNKLSDFKTAYEYTYVYVMAELDADTYVYIADGGLNREHTDDLSLLGDTDLKEDYGEEPERALKEDRSSVTSVYDNGDWGHMLSAFAPIKNTAGEIVGIVGVDMSSDQVGALTAEMMKPIFVTIAVVTAVLFLLVYLLSRLFINRIVIAPLDRLKQAMEQIAVGALDVKLTHKANDEIGQLAETFNGLINTLQYVFGAVNQIKDWAIKGELRNSMEQDERIKGNYHDMIQGMNHIMEAFTDHLDCIPLSLSIVDTDYRVLFMNKAGQETSGFDASQVKNKKCYECLCADECRTDSCLGTQAIASGQMRESEIRTTTREMQAFASPFTGENGELLGFTEVLVDQTEIKSAERNASENAGKMEKQMALARKQADYQKMGVGALIDSLEKLARGDLSIQLKDAPYDEDTKEIHDSFYQLEKSLVDSCAAIKSYIDELDDVLAQIADKNLNVGIEREYKGDFSTLKSSINHIVGTLNGVFDEILVSTEQVENAATQVSGSAQSLAHGASEQAGAIQQISATVSEVAAGTRKNAEDANKANGISYAAKEDAQIGNRQMSEMITAMEGIKDSSRAIANIIKVIDDIAFQTNILALNAAVEAARAGEQGKGFAVVAGEVRNLAVRSAAAAKETTELIDTSLTRVERGARIADDTAKALGKIVDGVTDTVDIIATIAEASSGQAASIAQINNGVEQISNVTQSNTATAEASASSSEQMAAQTQVLKNMMQEFQLKKGTVGSGPKLLSGH